MGGTAVAQGRNSQFVEPAVCTARESWCPALRKRGGLGPGRVAEVLGPALYQLVIEWGRMGLDFGWRWEGQERVRPVATGSSVQVEGQFTCEFV